MDQRSESDLTASTPTTGRARSPMRNQRSNKGPARRGERGATLVEYAILVAVFAIPTITAIQYLQHVSEAKVQHTADGISNR